MSNTQLFFALAGMFVSVIVAQTLLLNSRISDLAQNVNNLIQYMVGHGGRIATLEERTKGNQQ
jgi:hypothetical protein